jgi:ribonuclease P protein component
MFARSNRLSRPQFEHFFKTGKRINSPELTVVYAPHTNTHAAAVVGKKVARKAHDRNRLRRRIYGVLYRALKKLPQPGVYIVIAKPAYAKLSKPQQLESVQKILNRITIAP